jgi:hypothetical protein
MPSSGGSSPSIGSCQVDTVITNGGLGTECTCAGELLTP